MIGRDSESEGHNLSCEKINQVPHRSAVWPHLCMHCGPCSCGGGSTAGFASTVWLVHVVRVIVSLVRYHFAGQALEMVFTLCVTFCVQLHDLFLALLLAFDTFQVCGSTNVTSRL